MPPRKERLPVVFDTNDIVGYYLSCSPHSANLHVFRLWRDQRTLQLIVSEKPSTSSPMIVIGGLQRWKTGSCSVSFSLPPGNLKRARNSCWCWFHSRSVSV